ncbi:MAG: sensor histidine kinase [Candidatus Dormibacteraceae bacterium]
MLDSQSTAKKSDPYEVSIGAIAIPLPKSSGVSVRLDSLVDFLAEQLSHSTTPSPVYPQPAKTEDEEALRQWLARELHDDVTPALTTLLVQIEQLKRRPREEQPNLASELTGYQDLTRQALDNLRRLLHQLREESTSSSNFPDQLSLVLERFEAQSGIHTQLQRDHQWPEKIPSRTAHNLIKVVEEALRNVRQHSAAKNVLIELSAVGGSATLKLADDGNGQAAIEASSGHGLVGMHERAALIGGKLRIVSSPEHGTTIWITLPGEKLT